MRAGILRLFVPGAALLLLVGLLAPLPSVAQTDPTATPSAGVTATVTEAVTNTATAVPTLAATAEATSTVAAPKVTATATVTATVTATATPKVTTAAGKAAGARRRCGPAQGVRLRVRSGPGASYPIVARLANGQAVNVLGRDASSKWLLVEFAGPGGDVGWISANYAAANTPVAQLPVSSVMSKAKPAGTAAP